MKRIVTSSLFVLFLLVGSLFAYGGDARLKAFSINPVEQPLLTRLDFAHAQVVRIKGKAVLQATLTDSGSSKLEKYSLSHVGQRLAIMIGDEVIADPLIRTPLNRKIEIDALSGPEALNLVNAINQHQQH